MPAAAPPAVMTVAGTDSGGGAGIAADLKSFAAQGVYGTFAVTVVTAQNTRGIVAVQPMTAEMVGAQIDALLADFDLKAAKTGLLFTAENVQLVADRAALLPQLVVDPVLVRGTGEPMLNPEVKAAYLSSLFDSATVITPNVAEAALLTGRPIAGRGDASSAAEELHGRGIPHVVVTGLLEGDSAIDFHASDAGVVELTAPRIESPNIHGTGCSFAATITARLAHGDEPGAAIRYAKDYVARAIQGSSEWRLGAGHGPIDHFA